MKSDSHQIIAQVYKAKTDGRAADELISSYMPFIKSETAKFLKRPPDPSDDELSIAMFAFYEAVRSYTKSRGAFLNFAALQIRSRLIDNYRKEKRNKGQISLDSSDEEQADLLETIPDGHDEYEATEMREATRQEIEELTAQMTDFGVSMTDVADNSQRQSRTMESCRRAIAYARSHPDILEDFLRTKRVPIARLAEGAAVDRKSLERHRRYLVAVLLICTNGYEILRGHIMQVLKGGC